MLHALADPWTQDFLRRALLELALVGIATVNGCLTPLAL